MYICIYILVYIYIYIYIIGDPRRLPARKGRAEAGISCLILLV